MSVPKYIDADRLLAGIYSDNPEDVMLYIATFPAADVVEVCRCGECKHLMQDGRCYEFADDNIKPSVSDYCSYGERKDG